jgi:hypothetical protein
VFDMQSAWHRLHLLPPQRGARPVSRRESVARTLFVLAGLLDPAPARRVSLLDPDQPARGELAAVDPRALRMPAPTAFRRLIVAPGRSGAPARGERVRAGFDALHPTPFGDELAADEIARYVVERKLL